MKSLLKPVFICFYILLYNGFTGKARAQLVIRSGSQFVVKGSASLVLHNTGLSADGVIRPGTGQFIFTGNCPTPASFTGGNGTLSFYDLVLQKSTNGIQLNSPVSVNHRVLFNSGDSLFLNGYILDLGNSGELSGELNDRRITGRTGGYVRVTADLNQPVSANPGQLGIALTSPVNLGLTEIRRGHSQQSGSSIYRYFDIEPANTNAAAATIRFYYFDTELAGISEANLGLFGSPDDGTHWVNYGLQQLDNGLNFVEQSGLNSLDRFTLSNISAPLPVRLIYFRADRSPGQALLNWACEEETGTAWYEPERSSDGVHFTKAGRVPASGNGAGKQFYSFADPLPADFHFFYRLKMTNLDGLFHYSPVVQLNSVSADPYPVTIYPNPVLNNCQAYFWSPQACQTTLKLYDREGRIIRNWKMNCTQGVNLYSLDLGDLPAGAYYLDPGIIKGRLCRIIKQ